MAKKLPKRTKKLKLPDFQAGGVIEDPMGQWKYPGQVTRIPGTDITMQGVNYPVLGVSDTGDTKMMQPGGNYKFKGKKVTEYPQQTIGKSQTASGGLGNGGKLTYAGSGDLQKARPVFHPMQAGGSTSAFPVSLQERQNWNDFARYAHQDPNFGNPDIYDKDTQYGYNKLQEYNKTHPENLIRTPEDVARVQQGFTMLKANPGQYGYAGNWSSGKDLKVDKVIGTQTSSTLFPAVSETINQGKQSTTTNYGQDYEKYQAAHPVAQTPSPPASVPSTTPVLAMNQFGGNVTTAIMKKKLRMAQNGTGLSGPVLRSGPNVKNSAPPSPIVTEAPRAYVVNNTFPMQQGGHVGYNWQTPKWEIVEEMQNGGSTDYSWAPNQPQNTTSNLTNTGLTTSYTKPGRQLTQQEIDANRKSGEEMIKNQQIAEYQEKQRRIQESNQAQGQPFSAKNLQQTSQAIGDKLSLGATRFGDPGQHPILSKWANFADNFNPAKMVGDMAGGLGSVPQDIKEGKYKKAALEVGTPIAFGMLDGIKLKGTSSEIPKTVYNLEDPASEAQYIINHPEKSGLPKLVNQEDRTISELTSKASYNPKPLIDERHLITEKQQLLDKILASQTKDKDFWRNEQLGLSNDAYHKGVNEELSKHGLTQDDLLEHTINRLNMAAKKGDFVMPNEKYLMPNSGKVSRDIFHNNPEWDTWGKNIKLNTDKVPYSEATQKANSMYKDFMENLPPERKAKVLIRIQKRNIKDLQNFQSGKPYSASEAYQEMSYNKLGGKVVTWQIEV